MLMNVLVGVDGRSGGHDAVALARRLVESPRQLTLVHVHEETTGIVVHDFDAAARDEAQWLLEGERESAGPEAKSVSIAAPSVGAGLHRVAEQNAADLLVVGTCRHGFVGRVLLGDDTRACLDGAPCPVAIAPLGYAQASVPIALIGVGYDASPESDAALALARTLAADGNAKIRALSVISALPFAYAGLAPVDLSTQIDTLMDEARTRLSELDGVEGRVAYGLPVEELATFGEEVDLLLVGSRHYGPARHLMLGSTAKHLTRTARCPLLVLPRAATGPATGRASAAEQAAVAS
ncbi:MAG: universal stress protein [Solirubrobacteraceae bacterium]